MISLGRPYVNVMACILSTVKRMCLCAFLIVIQSSLLYAQMLINEVVTDPQVDWNTNSFDGTNGLGIVDTNDEWVELYVTSNGLDLTGWTIDLNDGTNESGVIAAGGAFVIMNYISATGGMFTDTDAGDYIVLGQPNTGSMDATITVTLRDNTMAIVDQVEIAAGSGTLFTGASSGISDESIARIPNGQDTDVEADDFVLTQATLGTNNSPTGTILINEVITEPQIDWSTNGFVGTDGGGTVSDTDEWIELYIGTTGLNLTKWTIDVVDGTPFSGDLSSRDLTGTGAFQEITYFGSGSFTSTVTGDYLVLGNPQGSEVISNTVTVTLTDPYGSIIDVVEIASGSGTGFTGNSNDANDESVCRIPNGVDTDVEANDFVQTRATLGANNSPQGVVLINEIVTDPQQDWSLGGFTDAAPGGAGGTNDEWIELYIGTTGLNLIKWDIAVVDGTDFNGDLTSSGAFTVSEYIGSGSFNNTMAGDYLILGNPVSTEQINDDVYITLTDPYGVVVDDVELGDDIELDGAGDGAPDGSASGGASSDISDEAIFRVPLAEDTNDDVADFRRGLASLGTENGIIYVDASAPDDTGFGRLSDPKQLIQSGVDIAVENGRVIVAAGTYSENITISNPVSLEGANAGIAGNGTRGAETVNDVSGVGITISSDTVTINGIQLGTDASTSSITNGIVATGNTGVAIQNNVIYTNSLGITVGNESTGTISVTDNVVSMLAIEDATSPTNGSIGIAAFLTSGDVDLNLSDNDISNASLGISTYSLQSSIEAVIDGGTFTGCMTGILPSNTDGVGGFYPSDLTIQNVTMSGFATDSDVTNIDTETAIYAFTAGGTTADDITLTINNLDVSGVNNDLSNYSGIVIGDFPSASDGAGIDATIINCNIHDNENRGVYVRGGDAVASISQSLITGNGFNPTATGGNPGFSVIVREGASATVSNSFITNPASLTGVEDIPNDYYISGLGVFTGGSLTVSGSNLNQNGNGFIAETSTINLSGNYFNSIDESTIQSLVGAGNDFTPWLSDGTDTDLVTTGFQGDFDGLYVGPLSPQTSGDRIQEAHDLLNTNGTISLLQDDYVETLTVTKNISVDPEANTTIDDITLNGGRLTVLNDLEVNNMLTLTNGILDIDLDDGDKNDDPSLILNNAVAGTFNANNHIEGRVQVLVGASTLFDFPVGDAGAYRPAQLTPTNAATFEVSHIGQSAPVGGGTFGDMRALHGTASSELTGNIESTLTTRYWDIDVLSGTPGSTDVTLQIESSDEASDPVTLGMLRFDGTDWVELTLVGASGSDPYTISGQTSSFSEFTIYSTDSDSNPLPVELIDFHGRRDGLDIKLNWATLTEVNADYFQVERSDDGTNFRPLGSVDAHGNSSEKHEYGFVDMNVNEGVHYYRLMSVDADGSFEYSSIVRIKSGINPVLVYPNPVYDRIQIGGVDQGQIEGIAIYDMTGRLKKIFKTIDRLNIEDLIQGEYLISVKLNSGEEYKGKILKR